MKLNEIRDVTSKVERGAWVNEVPNLPGVRIKARGTFNSDYNKLYMKLRTMRTPQELMDDDVLDEIDLQLLINTILLEWDGIEDAPYTKETAETLLRDPEYAILRRAVVYAGNTVVREGKLEGEQAAGN